MKTTRTSRFLRAVALVLVSMVGLAGLASAQDESTGDDPGTYGRVRVAENGLSIERANDDDDPGGPVQRNSPVYPGDIVRTEPGQRVEIELASGTLVRLDGDTELTFVSLPDPYAEVADHTVLQLQRGSARVMCRLAENQELRVDTPTSSVYAAGGGDMRVDVDPDGTTDVTSLRGVVEVAGSGGSVVVRSGMRTAIRPDEYPDEAVAYSSFAQDPFDRWCGDRDHAYASRDASDDNAYRELPQEVRPYYRELSSYGQWVDTNDYGYAWVPSNPYSGWRPYSDGYWSYGPSGYFWVGSEPWGWAPYHYGRWAWSSPYGWCWVPGRVFAGAWVAWSWGSVHIGWAPLGYWNQPVYISSPYYGYYDPGCWTFVSYTHFYGHTSCARYAVPYSTVNVQNNVVVARAPGVSPARLAGSPETRLQAAREARAIGAPRVQAIERGVRPTQTMRDVERRLVADRGRQTVARGGTLNERWQTAAGSRAATRFPRQLTTQDPRRATGRTGRPAPSVDRTGTADADRRVRDLYQRMASPRTTRDPRAVTRGTNDRVPPQATPAPRPQTQPGGDRRTTPPQRSRQAAPAPRGSRDGSRDADASPRPSPRSMMSPRAGLGAEDRERFAPRSDVERDLRNRVAPQPGPQRRIAPVAPRTNTERQLQERVDPGRMAPRAAPPQPRGGGQVARPPAPQPRSGGQPAAPRATGRGSGGGGRTAGGRTAGGRPARESGNGGRGKDGRR